MPLSHYRFADTDKYIRMTSDIVPFEKPCKELNMRYAIIFCVLSVLYFPQAHAGEGQVLITGVNVFNSLEARIEKDVSVVIEGNPTHIKALISAVKGRRDSDSFAAFIIGLLRAGWFF